MTRLRPRLLWLSAVLAMVCALTACADNEDRSSVTLVLGYPRSVDFVTHTKLTREQPAVVRITSPGIVRELVRDLNHAVALDRSGATACGSSRGGVVTLRFNYLNGDRWTVTIATTGCLFITAGGSEAAWADRQLLLDLNKMERTFSVGG